MEPILDWFNITSYDLHGIWDRTNPYLGPYINSHTNLTEVDLAMDLLWRNGIDPKQVVAMISLELIFVVMLSARYIAFTQQHLSLTTIEH
jgi:hypothetical protein